MKVCCNDCKYKKQEEICLQKYGVKSTLQLQDVKRKINNTMIAKYGGTGYQSQKINSKIQNTMTEKYGVKYSMQSQELKQKLENSIIEKYGVKNVYQSELIKNKIKEQNFNKYGVEYTTQRDDVKEKIRNTCMNKYGVDNPAKSNIVKDKMSATCLKKYGVNCSFKSPIVRQKIRQTNLIRYGVEYPAQNQMIYNKIKQTNLQKYGVACIFQDKHVIKQSQLKRLETMSKNGTMCSSRQQRYICKLLNGELNKKVGKYVPDIVLMNMNTIIEYDGSGHKMSVNMGFISEDDFAAKEDVRNQYLISKGWKIIRIISNKDLLPSDVELLKIIHKCINIKNKLILIDIDNNIIKYDNIVEHANINNLIRVTEDDNCGKKTNIK